MASENSRFPLHSRRLIAKALGLCALLALAAFAGNRSVAQTTPPQQAPPSPAQADTQDATPTPAQPAHALTDSDAQSAPVPAQQDAAPASTQPATPAANEPPAPNPNLTPEERRKQQVAQQCADLLKLATDLKAQVDKSRKDELSLVVVRKAAELEQMAHKVRSGSAPLTASE